MNLGELIELLRAANQDAVLKQGFRNPHSWRGDYSELAFEPALDVRVSEMLHDAVASVGKSFPGYKGGMYVMSESTPVHFAFYGHEGEPLTEKLLKDMLGTWTPASELANDRAEAEREDAARTRAFVKEVNPRIFGEEKPNAAQERMEKMLEADSVREADLRKVIQKLEAENVALREAWAKASYDALVAETHLRLLRQRVGDDA